MTMTKRAILYVRVSTDEQAEKGYSLPSQLDACRKYAAQHDMRVAGEVSDDYSGAKLDRPGLDRVRAMLERHEADAVVVYNPDRLTRSLAHSLLLREEWRRAGVELHYCNRGKSEDNPEGQMTENIEAVFGDYWRTKIIESSVRGRRTKAASGRWPCDGHAAYGYRKEGKAREAHLVINEPEAEVVQRVFALYTGEGGQPLSLQGIVSVLTAERVPPPNRGAGCKHPGKGWHKGTLRQILKRRAYIGEFRYGGTTIHLPELALIEPAMFKAAEERRNNSRAVAVIERKYDCLLAGHLRCACGMGMSAKPMARGKYLYYACNSLLNKKHMRECEELLLRADDADATVWEWLSDQLMDEERLDCALREVANRRETESAGKRARLVALADLIANAENKVRRLAAAFASEADETVVDALQGQLKQAGRERSALAVERDALAADVAAGQLTEADIQMVMAMAVGLRRRLQMPTFEQKRQLLNLLRVQVKLQWNAQERGVFAVCELNLPPTTQEQKPSEPRNTTLTGKWLPISKVCGTSSSTTTTSHPSTSSSPYCAPSSISLAAMPWLSPLARTTPASHM